MHDELHTEIDGTEAANRNQSNEKTGSRRRFLAGVAGASILVSGLAVGQQSLADDEGDDDHDNSGSGSKDDSDNSGPGSGDERDDRDSGHGLPPSESEQVSGVTTVEIVDERFMPNNILVETGQTVTWINNDDDQHTASGRGMDSGVIDPGREGSVTFLEPGEYNYTCNFHPEMLGLVTVTGESRATPDAAGASDQNAPMAADVAIVDFAFDPEVATVAAGGSITWTNVGAAPHTVLADWTDSDIMEPTATFTFTFSEPGIYEYQCGLHPAMVGTIKVIDADSTSTNGTPVSEGSTGPDGVWLIEYELDDPDAFPYPRVLVQLQQDRQLSAEFISDTGSTPIHGLGEWTSDAAGQLRMAIYGVFFDAPTGVFVVASIIDSGDIDPEGRFLGAFTGELVPEGGAITNISGASSGRRLSS